MAGVAEEAGKFGALDGAAGEDGGELRLGHMATFLGGEGQKMRTGTEWLYDGLLGGMGIVGADGGTGIAPIEASVEVGAGRKITSMLYGEIGEAAARIYRPVGLQRSCGTGADATAAFTTISGEWQVRREMKRGENFAKKEIAAHSWNDKMIVEADETETGTHSPITLTERRSVNTYTGGGTIFIPEILCHNLKTLTHNDVIIGAEGIGGNARTHAGGSRREGKSATDDAFGTREKEGRVGTKVGVVLKIMHRGMHAALKPAGIEPLRPILNRMNRCDGYTAGTLLSEERPYRVRTY